MPIGARKSTRARRSVVRLTPNSASFRNLRNQNVSNSAPAHRTGSDSSVESDGSNSVSFPLQTKRVSASGGQNTRNRPTQEATVQSQKVVGDRLEQLAETVEAVSKNHSTLIKNVDQRFNDTNDMLKLMLEEMKIERDTNLKIMRDYQQRLDRLMNENVAARSGRSPTSLFNNNKPQPVNTHSRYSGVVDVHDSYKSHSESDHASIPVVERDCESGRGVELVSASETGVKSARANETSVKRVSGVSWLGNVSHRKQQSPKFRTEKNSSSDDDTSAWTRRLNDREDFQSKPKSNRQKPLETNSDHKPNHKLSLSKNRALQRNDSSSCLSCSSESNWSDSVRSASHDRNRGNMVVVSDPFQAIPKFDPNENIEFKDWWLSEYLPVAKQLHFSEKETIRKMRSCLNKTARKAYDTLVKRIGDSKLSVLLKELNVKFETVEKVSMSLLYGRKLRRDETVLDYAVALEELYEKVDPHRDSKKRDRVLAEVFRKGIPYGLLQLSNIVYPYPKKLRDILKRVRHYENEWNRQHDDRTHRGGRSFDSVCTFTAGRNYRSSDNMWPKDPGEHNAVPGLLPRSGPRRYNNGSPSFRNPTQNITCFQCGEQGHYANDCRSERSGSFAYPTQGYSSGGNRPALHCQKCGEANHRTDTCPYRPCGSWVSGQSTSVTKTVSSGPSAPRMASTLNSQAAPFASSSSTSNKPVKVQLLNQIEAPSSISYKAPGVALQVQVNGVLVVGVCDTGANVSLISEELYEYIGSPGLVTGKAGLPAQLALGSSVLLEKVVELELDFGVHVASKQQFFVVPTLQCPGILIGMNVVRDAQIKIEPDRCDAERDRVYIGPQRRRAQLTFSEVDQTGIPLIARVAVSQTTDVPAGSITSVPVRMDGKLPSEVGFVAFNECLGLQKLDGCDCLVSLDSKTVWVSVFNASDRSIRLRDQCHIGEVMPVEVDEPVGVNMHYQAPGLEEDGSKLQDSSSPSVCARDLLKEVDFTKSDKTKQSWLCSEFKKRR